MDPVIPIVNYGLMTMRLAGLFLIVPFYSTPNIPGNFKVWLVFPLALMVFMVQPMNTWVKNLDEWVLAIIAFKELFIGFLMGYCIALVIEILAFTGSILSTPMGLTIAQAVDPASGETSTVLGQFNTTLGSFLFVCLDFHHQVLTAYFHSYEVLPMSATHWPSQSGINFFTAKFAQMFLISLQISIPILTVLILINFALGVLTRTLPKLNIFMIGIPLQIMVGMVTYVFTISFLSGAIKVLYMRAFGQVEWVLKLFMNE